MSDRTFLLQDWTTVSSSLTDGSAITQSEEGWLDTSGFADATYWIDVVAVSPPGASSSLQLLLETAPTCDDSALQSWFQPTTGPILLGTAAPYLPASSTPIVVNSVRSASSVSLSRYLRWRIVPSTGGAWSLAFRIRVVASRSSYFVPTDLSGCLLWLRSDLGIGLGTGTSVSSWADSSGNGNNTVSAAAAPTYVQNSINGFPVVQGNGTNQAVVTSAAMSIGSDASILAVVIPAVSPQLGYSRIVEQLYSNSYYLGTNAQTGVGGTLYKLIVNKSVAPFGTVVGGAITAGAATIVSGVYNSSTLLGSLYVNGTSVVTPGTFPKPTASGVVNVLGPAAGTGGNYWNGSIAEALIYSRALSAAELTRVHRYLGGRYGIAVP